MSEVVSLFNIFIIQKLKIGRQEYQGLKNIPHYY